MSEARQKLPTIPRDWCERVSHILRSADESHIFSTPESGRDWSFVFPDTYKHERFLALADALDITGVTGRHIFGMEPPCDTYAFWFSFRRRKLYAKIGLLTDGEMIFIFSSHIPRKGEEKL